MRAAAHAHGLEQHVAQQPWRRHLERVTAHAPDKACLAAYSAALSARTTSGLLGASVCW